MDQIGRIAAAPLLGVKAGGAATAAGRGAKKSGGWDPSGRWLSRAAAIFALLCVAGTARGADADLLHDPFHFSLGTFVVGTDTRVRVNGQATVGDEIDLEQVFGASDTNRFRLDGYWRFADRHKVRFLWFDWRFSAERAIEEEISFEGEAYPVGANVDCDSDFSVYELAYEYAFLRRQRYEITGSLGVHYTTFAVGLDAMVEVDDDPAARRTLSNEASVDAPLPVLGLRALWRVGHDFWLDASAQYFALSIDDYSGSLRDYRIALVWQPRTYLGVGVGYNSFTVDVRLDRPDYRGSLDWTYYGPQVFVSASF